MTLLEKALSFIPEKPLAPTIEQEHILAFAKGHTENLQINALAGSGKTSTLEMIQRAIKTKPILYLCFNKRIAEEAEKRFPSSTSVRTLNGLGHRIWSRTQPKNLSLNPKKCGDILRGMIEDAPKNVRGVMWDCYWPVLDAVSMAKALGYIPAEHPKADKSLCTFQELSYVLDETPDDLTQDLVDEVLTRSIKAAYEGYIDYNDQVYMPALFAGVFPKFPLVAVDEAQDLNPVNHAMLAKLIGPRFMAVGDPFQSIYGFRGAVQSGMAKLKDHFSMTEADLSVSFRCPRAIVEHAQWRAPNFKWIKDGGSVNVLKHLTLADISDSDVIICRNNAPLFRLAIHLLMSKRSVSVGGSDIGPKLLTIMKKLGSDDMSQSQVKEKIAEWLSEKEAKGSKSASDLAACMTVFASYGTTLSTAIAYAQHLFEQRGAIRLMTGHKSKGLEFNTVYHLDPWLCREDEQDRNLRYVITTRSADRLFEVNSKDIK